VPSVLKRSLFVKSGDQGGHSVAAGSAARAEDARCAEIGGTTQAASGWAWKLEVCFAEGRTVLHQFDGAGAGSDGGIL